MRQSPLAPMTAAMEDEEDELGAGAELFENYEDDSDRALTVHEAGHAVVARALGAPVAFVEIDLLTGNGGSHSQNFPEQVNNLAVCVAGCRAEHAFDARASRKTKIGDFRTMRRLLSQFPEAERRVARAEAYRLADTILKQHAAKVQRLADELMERRWKDGMETVRIEAGELSKLLDEEGRMDMEDDWLRNLAAWARNNGSVDEMWLFGSRADGTSRPDSDVDIGLGFAPPTGLRKDHDWAFGNFYALNGQWRRELEAIVGHHVSLEPITPEKPGTAIVRKWVLLWKRERR